MNSSPAGLAPVEGIPMRAQAILHREILHVHGLLTLTTLLLRTRLAILSPTFLDYVTSPRCTSRYKSRCQEPSVRVLSRSVRVAMPGTFGSRPFSLRSSRDARNLRLASFLARFESRCQEPFWFASFLAPFESRCQEPSARVLSRSARVAMPGTFGSRPFSLRSSRDPFSRSVRVAMPGTFGSRPFSLRSSRDARNLRCYLPTPTTSDSLSNLP